MAEQTSSSASPTAAPESLSTNPTAAERAMLEQFDAGRRLALLRIIVPALFGIALIGLPFAIQTDVAAQSLNSSTQDGIGVVFFALALLATWKRRANLASLAFFLGITGVIVLLLFNDAIQNPLDVITLPEFSLLILPIAVAGIFGGPRFVVLVTAASSIFTFATIFFTHHTPALNATLQQSNGPVVFTVPISVQLAFGALIFAATWGFRRTQRELGDIRVAYAREKELERLKDQFISSVNHELRTPIMALQGYIEIAQELGERGESQRQQHMLERSAGAADHLASLVKSVLSVRRIEADASTANPTTFPLLPTILAATELLDPREAGEQERELHINIPAELAVFADQDHVRQVALNLLSNASKYSPPGSPIEISARIQQPETARRGRGKTNARPLVEVAVRDHGLGIPPEQIPLLFQRFVRLERDLASNVNGTGLGLAICKSYIEAMGGSIWVESNGVSGDGSTFIFTLPLAQTSPPAPLPQGEGSVPAHS